MAPAAPNKSAANRQRIGFQRAKMTKATAILAYADLLALPDANSLDVARTQAALNLAAAANPGDADLAELQRVLDAL